MDRSYWEREGFRFISIGDLRTTGDRHDRIPRRVGVYVILLEEPCRPRLLDANHAGSAWTRDTDELLKSWIEGEPTLYVGKAGAKRSGLRGRTSALIRFSQNGRASHLLRVKELSRGVSRN